MFFKVVHYRKIYKFEVKNYFTISDFWMLIRKKTEKLPTFNYKLAFTLSKQLKQLVMKMKNIQTKSVGLFPLPMVILPKETIRLHIFQNQYKALINDCFATGKDFIVPFKHNGKVSEFGTCVKLVDVERFYPDGKMDIKVEGFEIVRISDIVSVKNLAYQIGSIESIDSSLPTIHKEELTSLFSKFLGLSKIILPKKEDRISVYEIARNLNLDKELKTKLLRNASNAVVQSKLILNELRIQVLTAELQNAAGFRYYMN
mgnify:CR=1 FL=1